MNIKNRGALNGNFGAETENAGCTWPKNGSFKKIFIFLYISIIFDF